jgi:hypothetical protein
MLAFAVIAKRCCVVHGMVEGFASLPAACSRFKAVGGRSHVAKLQHAI